jgi:putative ABC transport system permease protein
MAILTLALKSLWNRRITALLTLLAIALSVALLLGVERLRHESRNSFANTISATDLIVGARGGSTQLLLYSVFRLGNATNNISWQSFQMVSQHADVAWAIPISLGDSHRGYRVMGTSSDYFSHYRYGPRRHLAFAAGQPFSGVYDAVIGAEIAAKLGYRLDQEIVLSHGAGSVALFDHADNPFRITGILAATGTPVDQTIHVSLAGIEAIHLDWQGGTPTPGLRMSAGRALQHDLTPTSITAIYVGLKSRGTVFRLQRTLNDYRGEPLLAIMPGGGIARALGYDWHC